MDVHLKASEKNQFFSTVANTLFKSDEFHYMHHSLSDIALTNFSSVKVEGYFEASLKRHLSLH